MANILRGDIYWASLDPAQGHELPIEEIAEPAWCRDDYVRALADCAQLNALTESTYYDGGAKARVRGHLGEGFFGLNGELAGWAQNHGADAGGWVLDQRFE